MIKYKIIYYIIFKKSSQEDKYTYHFLYDSQKLRYTKFLIKFNAMIEYYRRKMIQEYSK